MKTLFQPQNSELLSLFAPVYGGSGQALLKQTQKSHHMLDRDDSESYYFRDGLNPTVNHVEGIFRQLYKVDNARLVQSGMAAINVAIFAALQSDSRLFISSDTFVDTQLLALEHFNRWGINAQIFDLTNTGDLPDNLKLQQGDVVVLESVSNPQCRVSAISSILQKVSDKNAVLIIDNTIPSSECLRIEANDNCIVVESLTKYHLMNTGWAGLVMTSAAFKEKVHEVIKLFGFALTAETASHLEKSLLTLKLRIELQVKNKNIIYEWLLENQTQSTVPFSIVNTDRRVKHPFIVLKFADSATTHSVLDRFTKVLPSPSFGGPQTMASIGNFHTTPTTATMLSRRGVTANILRLCCGIENATEIISDLRQSLGANT